MAVVTLLKVFEHEKLLIDDVFTKDYWIALGQYNQENGNKYFTLLHNGIKFKEYVGVIQVGNLTIEILPKIDKDETDKDKWQGVLISMLQTCYWMNVQTHQKAPLRIKHNSILDAYLELYLNQCEEILHHGLVKKYKTLTGNLNSLKGKLLFSQHILKNLIHKERFYVENKVFNIENVYNQILYKALKLIPYFSSSIHIKDKVSRLLFDFPEMADIKVNIKTFDNLQWDRKTLHYKDAIDIAAMLLLNYRPDIKGGSKNMLAILFDMNELWEEYLYRQIKKNIPREWSIATHRKKTFWSTVSATSNKVIIPDIVINTSVSDPQRNIIIDTKWKIPDSNIPADDDLKQMYVYNRYWQSQTALLVYPSPSFSVEPLYNAGVFAKEGDNSLLNSCGVVKISVLADDNAILDRNMGKRFCDFIVDNILK